MSRSWMQTFTGKALDPLSPDPDAIDIIDIAHQLGMQCRYNGSVRRFYSVAEHCVLLSHTVVPENALWALLHDATEAYVGDLIWPLKEQLPEFKTIEDSLMFAICTKYRLPPGQPRQVKEHDLRIVMDERAQLMAAPQREWCALEGIRPLGIDVFGWDPYKAGERYLARFHQLYTVN